MGGKVRVREKHVEPAGEVVAERELRGANGDVVMAKIYVAPAANGNIVCTFEITGDGEPSSMESEEILSSLGALSRAWMYLRGDVEEECRELRFPLGVADASGFEWFHVDPDMNALCERIMAIEICADFVLHEAVYDDHWYEREDLASESSAAAELRYRIQQRVAALAKARQSSSPLFDYDNPKTIPIEQKSSAKPLATELLLRRDTGAEVQIALYKPHRSDEDSGASWLCEYQITGLDEELRAAACDVDSLGALGTAFKAIGAALENSSLWLGSPAELGGWDREREICGQINWNGRYGIYDTVNRQIGHLMAVEVLRNRRLFDDLHKGAGSGAIHEEAILDHLREAEKIRLARQRKHIDPVHRTRLAAYHNQG